MYYIIANPLSGGNRGAASASKIADILTSRHIAHEVYYTEYKYHAQSLAEMLSARADCEALIVIGGDGTLSEVLNGMDTRVPLGLIPSGTGNDFAASANISGDVAAALEIILSGSARPIDYIKVGARRALNVTGTGFDVGTLNRFESHRQHGQTGRLWYYVALLATLFANERFDVHAVIDGETVVDCPLFLIVAANGRYFGAGMLVSPYSEISDGLMNVVIVKRIPALLIPRVLIRFLRGRLMDEPKYASFYSAKTLEITVTPHICMQRDGEVVDELPARFEIVSDELRMFLPE